MPTKTLVTAATSAQRQQASPAGATAVRHGAPGLDAARFGAPRFRADATVMSAARSCAAPAGSVSAAVIGNDIPGSPPWSPPV